MGPQIPGANAFNAIGRYRLFIENFPGIAFQVTPDFKPIFVHGAIEEITGYKPDHFLSKSFTIDKFIYPSDLKTFREALNNIRSGGSLVPHWEFRIVRGNGEVRWVKTRLTKVFSEKKEEGIFQGVIYDITEQKKTDEELKLTREKWRSLAENAPDTIMIIDKSGTVEYVNRAFAGMGVPQLIGENIYDLIQPLYRDKAKRMIDEVFNLAAFSGNFECRVSSSDGDLWYSTRVGPIRCDGRTDAVTLFFMDITGLKNAHKELEEKKAALENKNITLREILGQMEQEKKQIMDNVISNAENALLPVVKRLKFKGESRRYVELLEKSIEDLTSSFGKKIGSKRLKLTPKEIEIANMIRSGLASKEIAKLLNISLHTVEKHRLNIREKLGIVDKEINLTTYLQTL